MSLLVEEKFDLFIDQFEKNTYLHGFKKMNSIKSKIARRFFYIFFAGLVAFSVYLITTELKKYRGSITHVSVKSWGHEIWNDPFPAVTICNVNVVHKSQTKNISDLLKSYGQTESHIKGFFGNLSKLIICDNCNTAISSDFDPDTYKKTFAILEKEGYTVESIMSELAQPCDEMVISCKWKSKNVPCKDIFKLIKTTSGFCCSFNYFGANKFQNDVNHEENYRYYAGSQGEKLGLELVLDVEPTEYLSTLRKMPGFYILAASGYEIPYVFLKGRKVQKGQIIKIGLFSTALISEKDVRYLDPSYRECMFENEGNLEQTKVYSYISCLHECRTKAIYKYCKCVPYFRVEKTDKRRFCLLEDTPCLLKYEVKYSNLVISNTDDDDTVSKLNRRVASDAIRCNCFPNCNEVTFDATIKLDNLSLLYEYSNLKNYTVAKIYFDSVSGIRRIRSVTLHWDFLIAIIGGIFSFCMSSSFVTLFEVAYHFICSMFGLTKKLEKSARINVVQALKKIKGRK